ncbi:hypothetical protein BOTBODRAFT_39377 [Botryobasidium botryosum FD-172 SS1]|uniref:YABBY protein C-terminal domain-containing protein n=1 Tax=Botryobasidium botryosum (strain FD-172 SS1) TaxID=930990 RepID=A0A067LUC1_BOTB1|nr:hypothetical protein BOTBODRAFT_39377 [Botryobasidium botryosum FD-172 SS1]
MPKAAATKTSDEAKPARKAAPKKTTDGAAKKSPSQYQLYMKNNLPTYKGENPDKTHKEAFAEVAKLWKDAPENPNRGKDAPVRKAAPKKAAPKKKAATPEASADEEDSE